MIATSSFEKMPLQTYSCKKHGEFSGSPIKLPWGDNLDPQCPICVKEENQAQEEERQADFKKQEEKKREVSYRKMNIGKRFWDESFETFDPYTPELQVHLDACRAFANDHQGRMLIMIGKNGNGKDHLAVSILKAIGGAMYSVFEIELLLKESYSGKTSEMDIYQLLCVVPLLVINEIGKHKDGEWQRNFLSHVINKRYENLMPSILISNKHLKDDCSCPECLQNYVANDVISRIIESGQIMVFTGDDYRYKKREMRGA